MSSWVLGKTFYKNFGVLLLLYSLSITVTLANSVLVEQTFKIDKQEPQKPDTAAYLLQTEKQLDEVVISATPLHRKLEALPGSISIIGQLSSQTSQSTSINTVLEQFPGVQMQAGTNNTARLTIRGIGSRSPYATNRIRAFYNEIPLTGGDGATIVEDLEIWETGRIEIIRGPSSALYGPGLGGTLVFRPRIKVNDGWGGHFTAEAGSFNFYKAGGHLAWKNQQWVVEAGVYTTQTAGHRQNNQYERKNGIFRLQRQVGSHQLSLLINYVDLFAQIPSSVNLETFKNNPYMAAPNWLAIKGFQEYNKWQNGLTISSRITAKLNNHFSIYVIVNNAYESRPFNILDENTITSGIRNRLIFSGRKMATSLGFEVFGEQYKWKIYRTNAGVQEELQTRNRDERFFTNLFLHNEWRAFPETRVTAGVNLHHTTYRTQSTIIEENTGQLTTHYPDQWVLSPRLGLSQKIFPRTYLFASAGHGFSMPSSEEALLPDGTINRHLKPEEGINVDAGIRSSLLHQRLQVEITAYRIWVKNLLITRRDAEDQFYGENAGKTIHQGIESRILFNLVGNAAHKTHYLNLLISHTLMDNYFTKYSNNGLVLDGNKLPGLPKSSINSQLNYTYRNTINLLVLFNHISSQYLNDANLLQYHGHEIVGLAGAYSFKKEFNKGLIVKGGINNLLNQQHASMVLVNAPTFGNTQPRYYYPGMPRNFYFGVSYLF